MSSLFFSPHQNLRFHIQLSEWVRLFSDISVRISYSVVKQNLKLCWKFSLKLWVPASSVLLLQLYNNITLWPCPNKQLPVWGENSLFSLKGLLPMQSPSHTIIRHLKRRQKHAQTSRDPSVEGHFKFVNRENRAFCKQSLFCFLSWPALHI